MCDLDEARLRQGVEELESGGVGELVSVFPCAGDVREFAHAEAAEKVAASLGGCDILVTCAGGNEARCCRSNVPFYEQPVEVIDWGLDVNLKGAVYFACAIMPQMVAKKGGVICCLGSVTGFEGDGVGTMYGTAKSGLFNFVKGLALAGGPHNVRALCVTPGPVMTRPGMAGMKTLMGRAAEPIELVDFILFLASENGRSITGSNHVVDCGRLAMMPA